MSCRLQQPLNWDYKTCDRTDVSQRKQLQKKKNQRDGQILCFHIPVLNTPWACQRAVLPSLERAQQGCQCLPTCTMFITDPPAAALRYPSRSLSHLLTGWQLGATRLPFLIPHQTPASAPAAPRVTAQVAGEEQGEAFCAAGRGVVGFFYFILFFLLWSHPLFSARWKWSRYIYINTL